MDEYPEYPHDVVPEPTRRFPWPPAQGESVVAAFGETWTGASLRPRSFFRAMPADGTIRTALLYYIPLGIAVAGADLFWTLTLGGLEPESEAVLGELPLGGGMNPLLEFLMAPVILLLSLFIAAGVTHALLKLFGGANRSFRFTTRVFAFAYSPQILAVVPVIGTVGGFIWMVGIAIIGLREGHRTSLGRVLAAVLIPVTLALIFVAIAAFIAATGDILLT
ncbi:MAG TPA: Yip1 family protein [Longimicrobiales bacterium]|nr:Yip1 family protein [Longimicrobiales bacterium]